ncbi:universal stress protein [Amycolatopsis sp. NPDC059021]|uniref:universal stress protein n=1 Tax=Amycolatopsis sp. NPDC059021 TaxID=3346704 RepID=UPI0036725230
MAGNIREPVVVGVDGSASALRAVRWAAAEAHRRYAALRLVHVVDEAPLAAVRFVPRYDEIVRIAGMRGRRMLAQAGELARQAEPTVAQSEQLLRGTVTGRLRAESEAAGLLVLGTETIGTLGRLAAGSVTVDLAAHASCPVVLVRPHVAEEEPPESGPVVVGVAGTPASEAALAFAFEEAASRKTGLVVVHSWDDRLLASLFEESHERLDHAAVDEHERDLLGGRLADWTGKYPDVAVERVVVRGRPASRLLDFADRAQLLVVGSRGWSGFTGLLFGSTSQDVLSRALCPVAVVRDSASPDGHD